MKNLVTNLSIQFNERLSTLRNRFIYDETGGVSVFMAVFLLIISTVVIYAFIVHPFFETQINDFLNSYDTWFDGMDILQTS